VLGVQRFARRLEYGLKGMHGLGRSANCLLTNFVCFPEPSWLYFCTSNIKTEVPRNPSGGIDG